MRIHLWIVPKNHQAVESGPNRSIEIFRDTGIVQIAFDFSLRLFFGVFTLCAHEGIERIQIKALDRRRRDDLLLGENQPERIQQLLQLGRRRCDAGSSSPDPKPSFVAEGVVSALVTTYVDPVHASARRRLETTHSRDRLATTRVEKVGEPFLQNVRIFVDADDPSRVIDAHNDESTVSVRECTQGLSDRRQISDTTFELGVLIVSGSDALEYVQPLHLYLSEPVLQAAEMESLVTTIDGSNDGVSDNWVLNCVGMNVIRGSPQPQGVQVGLVGASLRCNQVRRFRGASSFRGIARAYPISRCSTRDTNPW